MGPRFRGDDERVSFACHRQSPPLNRSLKLAPASMVVPYQYSMIVWAVIFGYVVFGDVPQVATLAGAAIIIGAGLYIFLRERDLGRGETVVSPPV